MAGRKSPHLAFERSQSRDRWYANRKKLFKKHFRNWRIKFWYFFDKFLVSTCFGQFCSLAVKVIYFTDNFAILINVFTLFDFSLLFFHSAYECSKYPEIFSQIFTFFLYRPWGGENDSTKAALIIFIIVIFIVDFPVFFIRFKNIVTKICKSSLTRVALHTLWRKYSNYNWNFPIFPFFGLLCSSRTLSIVGLSQRKYISYKMTV